MIYVFDIDGTILNTSMTDYESSTPKTERIEFNNRLHDDGHEIIYYTARGMGRTGGDVVKSYELFYDLTKSQLDKFGVRYNKIILGKPAADLYIDDKGINDEDFFAD